MAVGFRSTTLQRRLAAALVAASVAMAPLTSAFAQERHEHGSGGGRGGERHSAARAPSSTSGGHMAGGWRGRDGGSGGAHIARAYDGGSRGTWNRGASTRDMHAAARSPERGAYYGRGNPGRGYYGRGYNGRGYFARGYYGWPYRPYGPAFAGFGYYNDWYLAAPFIGLAAWELADYEYLNEQQIRAQENALAMATSAPLNEAITWNDSGRSGSVTPLRDGRTPDGKVCREFQQEVNVDGKSQQAYGTACQEADGSWQIVDNDGEQ